MGFWSAFWGVFKDYMNNSSLHGAKFILNEEYNVLEKYKHELHSITNW